MSAHRFAISSTVGVVSTFLIAMSQCLVRVQRSLSHSRPSKATASTPWTARCEILVSIAEERGLRQPPKRQGRWRHHTMAPDRAFHMALDSTVHTTHCAQRVAHKKRKDSFLEHNEFMIRRLIVSSIAWLAENRFGWNRRRKPMSRIEGANSWDACRVRHRSIVLCFAHFSRRPFRFCPNSRGRVFTDRFFSVRHWHERTIATQTTRLPNKRNDGDDDDNAEVLRSRSTESGRALWIRRLLGMHSFVAEHS